MSGSHLLAQDRQNSARCERAHMKLVKITRAGSSFADTDKKREQHLC